MNNYDLIPEIGMGATKQMYSDRIALSIVEIIKNKNIIVLTEDSYKRTDKNGFSENQIYEYTMNPNGRKFFYKKTPIGWREVEQNPETGRFNFVSNKYDLILGVRNKYHDFSF